jgi:hypothetical protein
MKTLKEIKVTKIENGFGSAFPFPEEITRWFTENTMYKSTMGGETIHPFSLVLTPGMMIPLGPASTDGIKPGESRETEYNILAKAIAFKNENGKWDIYEKVIFNVYNRKTVGNEPVTDGMGMYGGPHNPIVNDWVVTIKTDDAPFNCDIDLFGLFDTPVFTGPIF